MHSLYLTTALKAVAAAEPIILHYFNTPPETMLKDDRSPVTIADQEAEAAITAVLSEQFPSHTFYGEEGAKTDLAHHKGYTWVIDPIDGTKNFVRGMPLFATQLALLHDGKFVLGVSNAPLLHELLYAEKGTGCFLNGEPVHVSKTTALDEGYISYGAIKYFDAQGRLPQLTKLTAANRWARGMGDFWSYHLLAQGKIDMMTEATTKIWDIAALTVIVEEAGGTVTQLDGRPLAATDSTSIIASNGQLHDTARAFFAQS